MGNSEVARHERGLPENLHESTAYAIKGKEQDSSKWLPERGLREWCPSSPTILFNVYHQTVIRLAEQTRANQTRINNMIMGIQWKWIAGSKLPNPQKSEATNSESKTRHLILSLFADDITVLGEREEISSGVECVKKVMRQFEEKSNDGKEEETLNFGTDQDTRVLGCWIGFKADMKKRAGGLWAKIKPQLWKSRPRKVQQATVVEACVESGFLFDAAVRTW